MPSLSKYITSSLICIFSFSLFAENIDYEELIQGVFQNSDQYPKRLLELGATNINYEVKKGGKELLFSPFSKSGKRALLEPRYRILGTQAA